MQMAPVLTALAPFLLLPAALAGLGHPAAPVFALYVLALLLATVAALLAIGIARLPVVCLGGFAAAGAGIVPVLTSGLLWPTAAALAVAPLAGLALGGLAWLLIRSVSGNAAAALLLALLLGLASLPALTIDPGATLAWPAIDQFLLLPVLAALVLLLAARRFARSAAARLHEAAVHARLPVDGLGLEQGAFRATALILAAGTAALAGGILALGPAPIVGSEPGEWVALSLALFAIGRLGGNRLGAALLAALPLALLPKLTVVLAPHFVDLTLAAALAALVLQLIVRADGSAAWQPPGRHLDGSLGQPRLAEQQWAEQ